MKTVDDLTKAMDALVNEHNRLDKEETGCCTIEYLGVITRRYGFTYKKCKELADDYPEADWNFNTGECH